MWHDRRVGGRLVKARVLAVSAFAALVAVPAAFAHGQVDSRGFRSTVTAVRPSVPGLGLEVLGGDERLRLENRTGKTIAITGYGGEPYLRFDADGRVFVNERSPTRWLNVDRWGRTRVPPSAQDRNATPRWILVGRRGAYEWHEHRAQWMRGGTPGSIAAAPDQQHYLFDWKVPATVDGRPLTIVGRLDYVPPGGRAIGPVVAALIGGGSGLLLALLGFVLLRGRRRGDEEPEPVGTSVTA
jgi:hypothetical protein